MAQRMTRLEAAVTVLRQTGEPMTATQIVDIGHQNKFFERSDKSLARSVYVSLNQNARETEGSGQGHRTVGPGTVMSMGDGRYAMTEWGLQPVAQHRVRADIDPKDYLNQRLDDRLKDVYRHLKNIKILSDERVCLLIEFCYLLKLYQLAVDLHARLPRNGIDPKWLRRVDRIANASRGNVRQ